MLPEKLLKSLAGQAYFFGTDADKTPLWEIRSNHENRQ